MLVQSAFRSQLFLSVLAHSSISVVVDGDDAHLSRNYLFSRFLNPFTPKGDQDRISPYNINTISCRQVMRINTNTNQGIITRLLLQNQIPQTNITRIVWQTIRRITIEILGEKRVKRIDELVDFHLCKLCHFLHNRKIVKIVKFAKLIPF